MSINTLPRLTLATLTAATWRVIDVSETTDTVEPEKYDEWTTDGGEVAREKECGAISFACGYVTLAADIAGYPAQITFNWTATGNVDGSFSDLYDFKVEPDLAQGACDMSCNFLIVDDDDEEIDYDDRDILTFLKSTQSQWGAEALALCPQEPTMTLADDVNLPTTDDMKEFTVERDDEPSISFVGKMIASTSSSPNNSSPDYSGSVGRSNILRLYRTRGGKFVCEKVGRTQWQGEKTRYSGAVCEAEADVMKFFGYGWLAKELYEEADIKASVSVE